MRRANYDDGRSAELPLPYADGAYRYASPEKPSLDGSVLTYEAEVPDEVRSSITGSVIHEAGTYRYNVDLSDVTVQTRFAPKANAAVRYDYENAPLSVATAQRTGEELLDWLNAPARDPATVDVELVPKGYQTGSGCVVYWGSWWGIPHAGVYELYLVFADGTETTLPLPNGGNFATALPSSVTFEGERFIYEVDTSGWSSLPDGVFRYTVDLQAKTLSLTLE